MRNLTNWLDGFVEYTEKLSAPALLRTWGGIAIVAAALERKVWAETEIGRVFPSLFTLLVAPPGVGKSVVTSLGQRIINQLNGHKTSSSSITRATVIEELNEAQRFVQSPGGGATSYNSLFVCINELGVLMPGYDTEMMQKLTDIWDCTPYSERRRNVKHNAKIDRPQINLLAGVTPGYLASILPEVAWEQGFLSRTILVYSGDTIRHSLFSKRESDKALWNKLVDDLRRIDKLQGEFSFTEEAANVLDHFHLVGHKTTAPMHPKLQNYNTRRPYHLLKLCITASVMRGDDKVVSADDVQTALDWLIAAEQSVPEIFKAMSIGGDGKVISDAWYYVRSEVARSGKAVPKEQLMAFLSQRVPAEKIRYVLEIMEAQKILRQEFSPAGVLYRASDGQTIV